MENFKFTEEYCDNLINLFTSDEIVKPLDNFERKHKLFIVKENNVYTWLWDDVNKLIKSNLGDNHFLTLWISILRYDKGDYFLKHEDSPYQNDDRFMSGGVELSKENDFEGGEFVINNEAVEFERGKLITHGIKTPDEIKEVTKGTRWSLHFGINRKKSLV